jgi:uncharacterized protein YjbJ (UPF0337 family)
MSAIDKMKDNGQSSAGSVKRAVGSATNDRSLEAEGQADKTAGDLKQAGEKVKDAIRR